MLSGASSGDYVAHERAGEFLEQLSAVARSLEHETGTQEVLDLAISRATTLIGACDSAGISIVDRDGVHNHAATGESVHAAHELQYEMREGPAVDALRDQESVTSPDLRNERRWPNGGPG